MKMYKNYTKNLDTPRGYIHKMLLIMNSVFSGISDADKRKWLMRANLTTFILIISLIQVSAATFGQSVTFNQNNTSIAKLFLEIRKQTGYDVLIKDTKFKSEQRINANFNNASLSQVMDKIVAGTNLAYTIEEKTIVLKQKEKSFIENIVDYFRAIDVKGKIVDENGKPLPLANITIKGKTQIYKTDEKGEFVIPNVAEDAVLVITYVGYKQLEISLKDASMPLEIKLNVQTGELEEVKVTYSTGYQVLPKERLTGAFSTVSQKQLDSRVAPDLISKLEGITSSLVFNKDPEGRSSKIRVRGESTIMANANPLIVVDNFPYEGDINNLNPNDIETVTILKDAAAASIWGVQAGNGVIVITTKRSKLNQLLQIDFNANISSAEKPDLFYSNYIAPTDYIDFERIMFEKGYYDGMGVFTNPNMPVISPVVEILYDQRRGLVTKEQADSKINSFRNNDIRNDMLDYIYRSPLHQQYALNLSGGSSKTSHLLSLGYDNDLSTVKNTKNDRITFSSQNQFLLLPNLDFKSGITLTASQGVNNGKTNIPNSFIYQQLKDDAGNELNIPQRRYAFENTVVGQGFLDWKYYPLQEPKYNNDISKNLHARFTTSAKYFFTKSIAAEINYQLEQSTEERNSLARPESYQLRNNFNQFAILDASNNYIGTNYPQGGLLTITNSKQRSHNGRAGITYNERVGDHAIIALAGFEVRDIKTDVNGSKLYGYNENTGSFVVPNLFQSYPTFPSGAAFIDTKGAGIINTGTTNRYRSSFGNLSYTYLDKYIFTASGRLDGSNYFGVNTNKKIVPLWSTGIKWDLSKESFYNLDVLPNLSFRTTYGYSGNLAKNIAAVTTFRYFPAAASLTGLTYAGVNNIPNPDLRWEKSGQLNLGLDFGFASNMLTGSIDYYLKKGTDLIGSTVLDPTSGVTFVNGNFSGMKSHGIDLLLNYKVIQRSFSWSGSFIVNYTSETVTRWNVPTSPSTLLQGFANVSPIVGRPLYGTYSYKWAGLDNTGSPMIITGDTVNKSFSAGALDNLKVSDLTYSGRYHPPVFGALTNEFSWKNISLTINLTYKLGHYFRRSSINYYNLLNTGWQSSHEDFAKRWQKPGDEAITNVPALTYPLNQTRESIYTQSDILIEKADHIRIQYINLNYTLSKMQFRGLPFKTMQLYGYANNIGIIWKANNKGIDPEYPYLFSPPARTFSIGARVSM